MGVSVSVGVGIAVRVGVDVGGGVTVAVAVGGFVFTGDGVTDGVLLEAGEGSGVKFGMMLVHPSKKMPTEIKMRNAIG